ncbi:MAG: thiamine-phosphate pyrophosphorylase [Candidatus Omnitrophica bacterium]|nr:thiamine-phosphate pyrophosphorylase [Candidatus Omnitrophota bacterium]MDD5352294.1 thiamine-phosphate pyrophosphorylase [Candidatus Omnitrophota bacterium]MDD5549892.1 thiamine-phosphate pyrophosphorylase [Candidatus Omnitrophota bacterium]
MNFEGKILRVIDANINRAKEGLRVCEDIMRLIVGDKDKTDKLKHIRHRISKIIKDSKIEIYEVVKYRDSQLDVGKETKIRSSKKGFPDIFLANSQRVKEALRVLEELFCILDNKTAKRFQNLRFNFYNVEKECVKKIGHLCNIRCRNLSQ